MKAISIHQPFASLIASGEKTIETRGWPTKPCGDLLIVSTKRKNRLFPHLPLGHALCVVEVVGCRLMERCDEEAACCKWYKGAYAWELSNRRRIEPFDVRGQQGFYEVAMPESKTKDSLLEPHESLNCYPREGDTLSKSKELGWEPFE